MARRKRCVQEPLDYHEGLSPNQVRIVLREFGLEHALGEFNEWLYGQTCPIIKRQTDKGVVDVGGVYEYDLFRWIRNKKYGDKEALVWD